ncbi:MAG: Maf family nucleotide pyrophosphatase [Pseudomonas sp.]|jgi:septum formation protein|nr:Maf family nucleotide pyrophosphatase [Pseudomonas sp.]MDY0415516.1 Maf family protein [Pseudomonas sp.]NLO53988.1 septum formation inhibitor Maf [Gammaproteobacteria bacterium]
MTLYLASTSPRRRELLSQTDLKFSVLDIAIDETQRRNELPTAYVERLAKEKALAGFQSVQEDENAIVLAADTIVVLEDTILGKPSSQSQAQDMLRSLSGRSHVVMTAFAIKTAEQIRVQRVNTTVFFRSITSKEIEWYWQTGEQQDKAGGYGIQSKGGIFVSTLSGSYSAVVGLPLAEVVVALQNLGVYPE